MAERIQGVNALRSRVHLVSLVSIDSLQAPTHVR